MFAENFITGIIILYITKEICGGRFKEAGAKHALFRPGGGLRFCFGGILCGAYSFILFVQMGWILALGTKIVFAVVATVTVYGLSRWKVMLRRAGVFVVVSFLMGGITIGLMYISRSTGITNNAAIYLEGITYINVTLGVTATFIIGIWIRGFFHERGRRQRMYYETKIFLGEQVFEYMGYIDSGNNLVDPISGKPVFLLSYKAMEQIEKTVKELDTRVRAIPYTALGTDKSILRGYQADKILLTNGKHQKEIAKCDIAPFDGTFPTKNCNAYDVLLNASLLDE